MSDSIEKDEEFRKLVKTREKLEREIAAVFSYEMLLGEYDNGKRLHNLQLEASRARKEIYRYIDRRVERAKQPLEMSKLAVDEMVKVTPGGNCHIQTDYYENEAALRYVEKFFIEESNLALFANQLAICPIIALHYRKTN